MYNYCEDCGKAWSGSQGHTNHHGNSINFPGIFLMSDFVSEIEEQKIAEDIYKTPFVESQSGRRKQVNKYVLILHTCTYLKLFLVISVGKYNFLVLGQGSNLIFFDSLLKLASGIIFYLLNLSASFFFTLVNTVKCGFKP